MASLPFVLLISFSSLFLFEEISAANPRLRRAYTALQAWKRVMYSDPKNTTSNWRGPEVCGYAGVYCAPAPQDNETITVAGVDLNGADIAGFLPEELGLLSDLALLHLNSNRFCGVVPRSLANLTLLFELDLSNNRFVGPFPSPVLDLPALKFLDIRYNEFEGPVPPQVFANGLDAVFVNNNRFAGLSSFPSNASVAVLVLANNRFSGGKLPEGIGRLAGMLEELVATNANLAGCLPEEIGVLRKLRLLDVSSNALDGALPYSMAGLQSLERLNVAHNRLSGAVPAGICSLPKLTNLTVSYNFLCGESETCLALGSKKGAVLDDRRNCLPDRPFQHPLNVCQPFLSHCY